MNETMPLHRMRSKVTPFLPEWVPGAAQLYLAHTEAGFPIRALARASGCHASTVLRQIRRIEQRRDDPLVDAALRNLGQAHFKPCSEPATRITKESDTMRLEQEVSKGQVSPPVDLPDPDGFEAEALRVLRRLCETGAVLAVAVAMEKAVVVRDDATGEAMRTGIVDRSVAEVLALKEWITPKQSGRITRYTITPAGRAALESFLLASKRAQGPGLEETQTPFDADISSLSTSDTLRPRRMRYSLAESPLTALARRKDKTGDPFLTHDLVTAGERLREDFELAQMGRAAAENWERFLASGGQSTFAPDDGSDDASSEARRRIADALRELGPGLSDVVLRCCCYLEGLETAEKTLGWSARSGKIVLRIALLRLKRHYDETVGPGGPLIG